ncbi:MAG TPA: hypothetical protein VJG83_05180 [archaeon]|nr:hypothetical protein [archaeon]
MPKIPKRRENVTIGLKNTKTGQVLVGSRNLPPERAQNFERGAIVATEFITNKNPNVVGTVIRQSVGTSAGYNSAFAKGYGEIKGFSKNTNPQQKKKKRRPGKK